MDERHWIRIAGSFLLFAISGTIMLVLWLNTSSQPLSQANFVALAKADADFVRASTELDDDEEDEGIPVNSNPGLVGARQLAQAQFLSQSFGQAIGVEVQFQRAAAPDARHEAVTAAIHSGTELTWIRPRPLFFDVMLLPRSLGVLGAFWALCLVLAWALVLPCLKDRRFVLLGSMGTALAHEIRNPVAAIRLHSQLLEETQPQSAGLIIHEAGKIEDLVNQWMYLARPEPPRKTEFALVDLLDQTTRALGPAAAHARVRIEVTASAPRLVHADIHRLGQVFHNVVVNAIQAMPKGGTLAIAISEKDVSFADTGLGFSPAALRRGAEMFYSEKQGGMGIGLSVARNIVRAHGGRLTFDNRPGGGAIVRVEI
jgi:signal transduction histidine kinase